LSQTSNSRPDREGDDGDSSPQTPDRNAAFASGNAGDDGMRGWFVGWFVPPHGGLRRRHDVEIKWGVHAAGERRARGWAACQTATTASVLVAGRFAVWLRVDGVDREIRLQRAGDYLIFGPGVPHTWQAIEASTVLTVRVPSLGDDEVAAGSEPQPDDR
jgi:hypothetical protein